ncbi:hypothetical protein G7Y89_g8693 [Cudoniella acicularis]|uniref:Mitochondrial import inner membrane translocase subunit TIM50 n=1 Tax=Cudoniella acicularis TaxID=354080 RepID=A0A8H4RG33_9HELO|nr:hypothetical protein G7Y89_g8693 [Cudoniella acicularis]
MSTISPTQHKAHPHVHSAIEVAALDKPPALRPSSRPEQIRDLTSFFEEVSISSTTSPPASSRSTPKLKREQNRRTKKDQESSYLVRSKRSEMASRDAKVAPSRASGGIPDPTRPYLSTSAIPAIPLTTPQHLLVIIDLNGTMVFRPSRKAPTKYVPRPHAKRFLEYCINTFNVIIWSSAKPENVNYIVDSIISPELRKQVIAIWGRDKFGLSPKDYDMRVQCYKRLTTIWDHPLVAKSHPEFASGGRWDQTNTVLVDDSVEKGRSEPFNIIKIPEFFGDANERGEILPQVHDYLNYLSLHSNVSACLRATPFRVQAASMQVP